MKILSDYDLTKLNTFGVHARGNFFAELLEEADLPALFNSEIFHNNPKLFLGGGSNVLFTKDFDGLVVLNKLKGINILSDVDDSVFVRAMGGEIWHDLVAFSVERELWGLENLSLIPGTVGAAPMQNIGAYGAELKEVLHSVEAYATDTAVKRIFQNSECEFGYRDSIFKRSLKGKYFISAITVRLSKAPKPNLSYKILADYLRDKNIKVQSPWDVSKAVSAIRSSKLPDPVSIPNAGSFFKNVFVDRTKLKVLQELSPDIPHFSEEGKIKIPAAWFIERCGPAQGASWKGYRVGNVGVHDKQALVLVNYGGASGVEIAELARRIVADVKSRFGLELVPEVNLL